ncbi:Hypothetical predicted protein [Octopus vulgaris]|uniref:Uncharacterized protein n=1 Tax=Octopus vulgaris TaxID=6645 RepID=A0AA36FC33_OCTVU|nr:Hypothetical predicted protein [Octopus vulgaris]
MLSPFWDDFALLSPLSHCQPLLLLLLLWGGERSGFTGNCGIGSCRSGDGVVVETVLVEGWQKGWCCNGGSGSGDNINVVALVEVVVVVAVLALFQPGLTLLRTGEALEVEGRAAFEDEGNDDDDDGDGDDRRKKNKGNEMRKKESKK